MFKELNKLIQFYSNKEYSFITGNGTSAIYLALKSSGLAKGSKIAVPNISCPDPVYSLLWAGYKPVFIDVNLDDYNINTDKLEYEIKKDKNIKGILAIHLFGNACDIVKISKLSKKYNLFLLEDCAQAFGNEIEEGKLGSFGDCSVFSFGNGKIIEVGHGGSIQSNNREFIEKVKSEYSHLDDYDGGLIDKLSIKHRSIYYKLYYLGIKFPILNILNMVYVYFFKKYYLFKIDKTKLTAIFDGLKSFDKEKEKRIKIIDIYISELINVKNIVLPKMNNKESILSRYTIVIDKSEDISKEIRINNIPSNTMYPMLSDRFDIYMGKNKYKTSYELKGKLLNLWTSDISVEKLYKMISILKG